MKIDITYDREYIVCTSEQMYELQILKKFLTREIANAWIIKKKQPYLNTERCFINQYGMVPINLWLEILAFIKKYNIPVELTPAMNAYITQFQLDYDAFKLYVDKLFDGAVDEKGRNFRPREYQIKAAYTLIKYRRSCGEISTSAGKTLIAFIMFKYLLDMANINRTLYIVPNVTLATQSAEKFELYESYLRVHTKEWTTGLLKSGLSKAEKERSDKCTILFGTFQSLCKRPTEYFDKFNVCICDECHHLAAESILKIFKRCNNLNYTFGVTGTFPKGDKIENLTIQSYVGPVVYRLTADELINSEKSATPVVVLFEFLNWATEGQKTELYFSRFQKSVEENKGDMQLGNKLLKQEQQFINNSYVRLKFIGDAAIKMAHNTLVLFGDIKGGYGKRLHEYIKDNSGKNVYYVDGNTKDDIRDYYKVQCENDTSGNTVIVASIGTFGEGVDISNIWNIFLVNTAKSERLIRQIVGRGLRNYPGKDRTILYDFVDDLRYSLDSKRRYYDNYMWKHYLERKKIYAEQNFQTANQNIDFSTSKLL